MAKTKDNIQKDNIDHKNIPLDPKSQINSSKSKQQQINISPNWKKLQSVISTQGNHHCSSKSKKYKHDKSSSSSNNGLMKPKDNPSLQSNSNSNNNEEIWFDEVDPCLIASSKISTSNMTIKDLCKEKSSKELTKCVAMDCEMVGTGFAGYHSALARVSIVNLYGHCVYDKFVKPMEEVTDYRTEVSGIRPENLKNAHEFKTVQQEVYEIIKDRILVGHSVYNDLKALYLSHPKHRTRDTAAYFRKFFNNRTPSLRKLSEVYLGVKIQDGEHDSVVDAQATMRLYTMFKKKWESSINRKFRNPRNQHHKQDITEIIQRLD